MVLFSLHLHFPPFFGRAPLWAEPIIPCASLQAFFALLYPKRPASGATSGGFLGAQFSIGFPSFGRAAFRDGEVGENSDVRVLDWVVTWLKKKKILQLRILILYNYLSLKSWQTVPLAQFLGPRRGESPGPSRARHCTVSLIPLQARRYDSHFINEPSRGVPTCVCAFCFLLHRWLIFFTFRIWNWRVILANV